jgi:hypothetical protein
MIIGRAIYALPDVAPCSVVAFNRPAFDKSRGLSQPGESRRYEFADGTASPGPFYVVQFLVDRQLWDVSSSGVRHYHSYLRAAGTLTDVPQYYTVQPLASC